MTGKIIFVLVLAALTTFVGYFAFISSLYTTPLEIDHELLKQLKDSGINEETVRLIVTNGFDTPKALTAMRIEDIEAIGVKSLGQRRQLELLLMSLQRKIEELRQKEIEELRRQEIEELRRQEKEELRRKEEEELRRKEREELRRKEREELRRKEESSLHQDREEHSKEGWSHWVYDNKCTLACASTTVLAPFALPWVVGAAGFTSAGIAAGSWAAKAMSLSAVTNIGAASKAKIASLCATLCGVAT